PTPAPDPSALARRRAAQRTAGVVAGSLGIAMLGAGAAFGVQAIIKKNESNSVYCLPSTNFCDPAGVQLRNDGVTAGNRSTALGVAGGVAFAGGIPLFLTAPKAPNRVGTAVVIGARGIEARGRW